MASLESEVNPSEVFSHPTNFQCVATSDMNMSDGGFCQFNTSPSPIPPRRTANPARGEPWPGGRGRRPGRWGGGWGRLRGQDAAVGKETALSRAVWRRGGGHDGKRWTDAAAIPWRVIKGSRARSERARVGFAAALACWRVAGDTVTDGRGWQTTGWRVASWPRHTGGLAIIGNPLAMLRQFNGNGSRIRQRGAGVGEQQHECQWTHGGRAKTGTFIKSRRLLMQSMHQQGTEARDLGGL